MLLDYEEIVASLCDDWTGHEHARRAEVVKSYEAYDEDKRSQVRIDVGKEISDRLYQGDESSLAWAMEIISRTVSMIKTVDHEPKTITKEDL